MATIPMSIMSRLRDETMAQHKRAESRPLEQALLAGTLPRPVYLRYLVQRYFIHQALEAHIERLIEKNPALASLIPANLLQLDNIQADLQHFGLTIRTERPGRAAQELISAMSRFARELPMSILGFYYVFEGSKNGARFIARSVRRSFNLAEDGTGTRYLDPHGVEQRNLWAAFKERMDRLSLSDAEADAIVEAAKVTFDLVSSLDDELYPSPVRTVDTSTVAMPIYGHRQAQPAVSA